MTPLRQRFLDDLSLRNYSPRTRETYLRHIIHFARHFRRCPAQLGPEEVRAYQLYLLQQKKASWSAFNQAVCSISRSIGCATKPRSKATSSRPRTAGKLRGRLP